MLPVCFLLCTTNPKLWLYEENDVCFLCATYYVPLILSYGYMKKIMCASYVVLVKGSTQEHPSSPISIESGTHTKQATFFRKHMCASWVLPSVTSLTERSVYKFLCWNHTVDIFSTTYLPCQRIVCECPTGLYHYCGIWELPTQATHLSSSAAWLS